LSHEDRLIAAISMLVVVGCVPQQTPMNVAYQPPPANGVPVASDVAPAPTVVAAAGERVVDEALGWRVAVPNGWTYGNEDGTAVLRSSTEAGMIVILFRTGIAVDRLEATLGDEIRGFGATQVGRPYEHATGTARTMFAEMNARDDDGTEIRGRGVAVAAGHGVLVILSATTAAAYDTLRMRADAVALSAEFFAPRPEAASRPPTPAPTPTPTPAPAPSGPSDGIVGCFEYYRTGTVDGLPTWSSSVRISFDGHGIAVFGASSVIVNSGLDAIESDPDYGKYTITGDTLSIKWNDGKQATFTVVWEKRQVRAFHTPNKKKYYLRC
jgi:hypothetical protein